MKPEKKELIPLFINAKTREVLVEDEEKSFRFNNKGHYVKPTSLFSDTKFKTEVKIEYNKEHRKPIMSREVKSTSGKDENAWMWIR